MAPCCGRTTDSFYDGNKLFLVAVDALYDRDHGGPIIWNSLTQYPRLDEFHRSSVYPARSVGRSLAVCAWIYTCTHADVVRLRRRRERMNPINSYVGWPLIRNMNTSLTHFSSGFRCDRRRHSAARLLDFKEWFSERSLASTRHIVDHVGRLSLSLPAQSSVWKESPPKLRDESSKVMIFLVIIIIPILSACRADRLSSVLCKFSRKFL